MDHTDPAVSHVGYIDLQIVVHQVKLVSLTDRYAGGERSLIAIEAQHCAGLLICLLEEAPLEKQQRIDHLIGRYEALRVSCLS